MKTTIKQRWIESILLNDESGTDQEMVEKAEY